MLQPELWVNQPGKVLLTEYRPVSVRGCFLISYPVIFFSIFTLALYFFTSQPTWSLVKLCGKQLFWFQTVLVVDELQDGTRLKCSPQTVMLNRPVVQVWQIRDKSTPGLLSDQTPEISVISNFLLSNLVLWISSKTAVKSTSSPSHLQRELRVSYK